MKVRELIELLNTLPKNSEVIMSRDSEGNGYSKVTDHDIGTVPPSELQSSRISDYYSDSHTDEQCCLEPGERKKFKKVVVLWPQ